MGSLNPQLHTVYETKFIDKNLLRSMLHKWAEDWEKMKTSMMKNRITILFITFLMIGINSAAAQKKPCNDFNCKMALARYALGDKPPRYKDALDLARGAESYDPSRKKEVYDFIAIVFNAIEDKRKEAERLKNLAVKATEKAEKAEKDVKDALKQAEVNLQKAKDEEAKALAEQAKAEKAEKDVKDALKQAEVNLQKAKDEEAKALAEQTKAKTAEENTRIALDKLKITANDAVTILLAEIDRNIMRLEYDSTFNKCQTAVKLDAQHEEVKKRILEIAYFYTETDTFQAAIKTLKLLNISVGVPSDNALPNRTDLLAAIQKNAPPQYFQVLEERYYPKMIDVEGGTFTMKDGRVEYEVRLNSYKMAETETTVWQYFLYLRAKRQKPRATPTWQYEGSNPMIYVSWYDAVEYCNWVSRRRGKSDAYTIDKTRKDPNNSGDNVKWIIKTNDQAQGYRLPTEAEWEYAARGGTHQSNFEYSGSDDIKEVAWYNENSSSRTQPVKRLKPNALGLYDMSGNVWEWCFDWYSDKLNISSNKYWISPEKGSSRSLRGGSWYNNNLISGVSNRHSNDADNHNYLYGFRLVGSLQDK